MQRMQLEKDVQEEEVGEWKAGTATGEQRNTEPDPITPRRQKARIKRKKSQIQKEEAEKGGWH